MHAEHLVLIIRVRRRAARQAGRGWKVRAPPVKIQAAISGLG